MLNTSHSIVKKNVRHLFKRRTRPSKSLFVNTVCISVHQGKYWGTVVLCLGGQDCSDETPAMESRPPLFPLQPANRSALFHPGQTSNSTGLKRIHPASANVKWIYHLFDLAVEYLVILSRVRKNSWQRRLSLKVGDAGWEGVTGPRLGAQDSILHCFNHSCESLDTCR